MDCQHGDGCIGRGMVCALDYDRRTGEALAAMETSIRLKDALRAAERALLASPLVKPYKRESEALEIIRAALATGAMSDG